MPDSCYHACLAMATGIRYETVIKDFSGYCERNEDTGLEDDVAFEWLSRNGFAYQMLTQDSALDGVLMNPWPPIPWAPVHILGVQSRGSGKPHAVVMETDGIIIDPNDDVRTELTYKDYRRVTECVGVWDLRRKGGSYASVVKKYLDLCEQSESDSVVGYPPVSGRVPRAD